MNATIKRIKGILFNPTAEWAIIAAENLSHGTIFMSYVVPLSLIPVIAGFIGDGLGGKAFLPNLSWNIVRFFIIWLGGAYVGAFITNSLAHIFGSTKDFDRAFALGVYAGIPGYILGITDIIPSLTFQLLAGIPGLLYGLYLFYLGLQPMMRTPRNKRIPYIVANAIVTIVVAVFFCYFMMNIIIAGKILFYLLP